MSKTVLENMKYRGGSEEGNFIRDVSFYLYFGNYAVVRGGFQFLSWVHSSDVLPLNIPGKQSVSGMCFRSFFPKPLLSLWKYW